jgi:pyruvate/2-oxoglutarate/acetoin dehydrogenase E1 component
MSQQVLTYREALRAGIEQALVEDERVFLMGEDVDLPPIKRTHFILRCQGFVFYW